MLIDSKAVRNPSGFIVMNNQVVADTVQCGHCGSHYLSIKGSGKRRGFCLHCMKPTCGAYVCDACIPFEENLRQEELK